MLEVRKSNQRGYRDHGWLKTYHSFSFGDYYDPNNMGFRTLRVINQDKVAPGEGFGKHPHRDMEIITYVIEGKLEHEDSLGNKGTIEPGEVQCMTAGKGILHSEYNPSDTEWLHLMQIWIEPNAKGLPPSYEQKKLSQNGAEEIIASAQGGGSVLKINQDATVSAVTLENGKSLEHEMGANRFGWLQVLEGRITINGVEAEAGDGVEISEEQLLKVNVSESGKYLLFNLP